MAKAVAREASSGEESSSAKTYSEETKRIVQQLVQDNTCAESQKFLSPLSIHFSQNHIRPEFQDGRLIDDAAKDIASRHMAPIPADEAGELQGFDIPGCDWCLLEPRFPQIEVILWRIKLREEDGSYTLDADGNELHGELEWYTLDNRRLYCLQKAAISLYPKEVRVLVKVIRQEDGSCREFRKFRSVDRGRSISVGHRDSAVNPRWSWRAEVGLPEEVLPAGSALPGQNKRNERSKYFRRNGFRNGQKDDTVGEEQSFWDLAANASLFVLVYVAIRLLFVMWRHYSQGTKDALKEGT
eukprot:TRINITY_DN87668_c0_g1_i1.p1 TRINITY_DN87668_c0_g1~~TRINITY_DN87668_c0_g1_i1.p1  ORF type:complete len:305 (-),score=35.09 TRINITY_DN87668_c0_g1_i1:170-1063(-)